MGPDLAPPTSRRRKGPPIDLRAAARLAERVLDRAMAELDHFLLEDGARVNPNRWKPLAARGDALQLFHERETHSGAAGRDPRALPALFATGKVRGRVESALYAATSRSDEELALLNAFLFGEEVVQGDVVAAVKQPAPSTAKYALPSTALPEAQAEFCGGKVLVKHSTTAREPVVAKIEYLEHRGYTQSPIGGELIAFLTLVPISERVKSGRTTVLSSRVDVDAVDEVDRIDSLCCLFRQVNDDVVEVFLVASADLSRSQSSGKLESGITPLLSVDSLLNVANLLECAEAKRLTVMKRENQQSVLTRRPDSTKPNECSMCRQKKKLFGGSGAFTACEVCGSYVCSRCRIDKRVFVPRLSRGGMGGGILERISACKPCSMAASSGPAPANPSDGPTLMLSERVRHNRAGSRDGGPSSSTSSSLGSYSRSRAGSGGSSSSGSTTSSFGARLVYYEGDFSARSRPTSSVSSAGSRKTSFSGCATPRSASGSVPPSPAHHKFVDHTPQLSGRRRRQESADGRVPSRAPLPSSSSQARRPASDGLDRPVMKERARSEDWVSSDSTRSAGSIHSEPRDRSQRERFPRFPQPMQVPPSRSRPEATTTLATVPARCVSRQERGPLEPTVSTVAIADRRKRATTSPATPVQHPSRGSGPRDLMKRMMELNKLAELNYDTAQRNAVMAHELRGRY